MIILDTDTCIDLLRGKRITLLRRAQQNESIGISFTTVGELYYGAEMSNSQEKNYTLIEQFLLSVRVVQTDLVILRRFGLLKATLQKNGTLLSDADLLIAATTLEKGTKLITGNIRHFDRIAGLVIETWR